jgi:hypothetical protein
MKSSVILNLVSIPSHRTVLGVNCEAYASSLPSTFSQHPLDIAVFILRLVGLPVEKVYQTANAPEVVFRCQLAGCQLASMPWLDRERRSGPEEGEYPDQVADQDEVRTLEYLREVFTMLRAGSTPDKPYSPMNTERKQCVETFSTRQLFLGVYDSPMRESLIRCKHDMSQLFAPAGIEERLTALYNHRPNVVTLRELAVSLGHRLGIQSPDERTRIAIIEWLGANWSAVEPSLCAKS